MTLGDESRQVDAGFRAGTPSSALFVSYAQNAEDVVLARAFQGESGFYIDIGAFDPVTDSVTKSFYDRGWRGINVDPVGSSIERFETLRQGDANVLAAITSRTGQVDFFLAPDDVAGHTTLEEGIAQSHLEDGHTFLRATTPCMTLADLCERYVLPDTRIDFMKIDVEGHEEEVVRSGDWDLWRPRVVVVEVAAPYRSAEPRLDVLEDAGYTMTLFDGLNRFFVDDGEQELVSLLAAPASVLDHFETSHARAAREGFFDLERYVARVEASNSRLEARVLWLEARLREAASRLMSAPPGEDQVPENGLDSPNVSG